MPASPLTTQYTRFAMIVFLPVIMFGSGCGDAGNINPNLPDTGNINPNLPDTGNINPNLLDTEMVGPPDNTGSPETSENTAAVVINEIFPEASQIELHNQTAASVDISGFWLCHTTPALIYAQMPDNTIIEPDGFLVVNWGIDGTNSDDEIFTFPAVPIPMNVANGEMGFYVPFGFDENSFASSNLLRDYVQWGEADHFRQGVAVGADIWPEGAFVPSPPAGQSFSFNGSGDSPDSWTITPPTIGTKNNIL